MKPVKKEKHTPKHYLPDTTPKIAAAGATVLVLLVVLSFVLSSGWMHGSSTGIILPGSEGDSPTVGTGSALLTGQSVDLAPGTCANVLDDEGGSDYLSGGDVTLEKKDVAQVRLHVAF